MNDNDLNGIDWMNEIHRHIPEIIGMITASIQRQDAIHQTIIELAKQNAILADTNVTLCQYILQQADGS